MNAYRMGKNSIERGNSDHWTMRPRRIEAAQRALEEQKQKQGDSGTQAKPEADASKAKDAAAAKKPDVFADVLHNPAERDPRGYILPSDQPDFPTATKFVNALIKTGVTVERATAAFEVAGKTYKARMSSAPPRHSARTSLTCSSPRITRTTSRIRAGLRRPPMTTPAGPLLIKWASRSIACSMVFPDRLRRSKGWPNRRPAPCRSPNRLPGSCLTRRQRFVPRRQPAARQASPRPVPASAIRGRGQDPSGRHVVHSQRRGGPPRAPAIGRPARARFPPGRQAVRGGSGRPAQPADRTLGPLRRFDGVGLDALDSGAIRV